MGNPEGLNQIHSHVDSDVTSRPKDQASIHKLQQACTSVLRWNSQDLSQFPEKEITKHPCQVTHLYLNFNCIEKLPHGLWKSLSCLQVLSLDGNDLTKLPDDLGLIFSLEELYLSENKLISLPDSLYKLSKLRIFKACSNSLRYLHPEIGQNICLEMLSVDENSLKRFPPTLGLLKKLKVLEANSNKLTCLPETLHFLESLETIDLSKNRLNKIPNSIGELKYLKHIDLSENQLVSLWETCESSFCLEKIFLDFNAIITLPPWFSDLEKVIEISLNSNNLSSNNSLPEGFGNCLFHLKLLDLRGNYITDLPESFGRLQRLETLLIGTPFDYLEKKATFQNGNWLRWLPSTFGELKNLVMLGAEENQLDYLPDSINNLINLKEIYLGSNLLISLPDSFCSLRSLEKCQLSKNKIKTLPEEFGNLETLTELHLDSNKLKTLPSSIKKCMKLEILDLSDNRLSVVPSGILDCLTALKALNMQQNRFEVPYTDIPHIAKKAHYKEPDPLQKDNWRGKNNSPYSGHENHLHIQQSEDKSSLNNSDPDNCSIGQEYDIHEDEESSGTNERNEHWDSSEEDWDKECTPIPGGSHQNCQNDLEEENWDNEVGRPSAENENSAFESGQFDLDEECQSDISSLYHQPVAFDFYGNPSRRIDLDIFSHRMLPYVFHSRSHLPFIREPFTLEDGQFEDFDE